MLCFQKTSLKITSFIYYSLQHMMQKVQRLAINDLKTVSCHIKGAWPHEENSLLGTACAQNNKVTLKNK